MAKKKKSNADEPPPEMGEGSTLASLPPYIARRMTVLQNHGSQVRAVRVQLDSSYLKVLPEHLFKNEELVVKVAELYAVNCHVKKLPEYINTCVNLTEVVMRDNLLKKIPPEIATLNKLQVLDVSGNALRQLPPLQSLPDLHTILASRNAIRKVKPRIFVGSSLSVLDLSNNRIKKLPRAAYRNKLRLDVSHNQIRALPAVQGKERCHIRQLIASYNQLDCLPEGLHALLCLDLLDISHNSIVLSEENPVALPQFLAHINAGHNAISAGVDKALGEHLPMSMTVLDLSHNGLLAAPSVTMQLQRLQELNLSDNKIAEFPSVTSELLLVRVVDISGNLLVDLDGACRAFARCETFNASRNLIAALPESMGAMAKLTDLDLSTNAIVDLSTTLDKCHLRKLKLAHNRLTTVPDQLGSAWLMEELDLSHNEIAYLPPELRRWRLLRALHVQGNRISTFQKSFGAMFDELEILDVSENAFADISVPTSVKSLGLSGTNIGNLDKVLVKKLINLERLTLRSMELTELPQNLSRYRLMRHLDVSENFLPSILRDSIGQLKALEVLLCARNELSELPDTICALPNLRKLDCSGNSLTQLPERLMHCPLQYLDASHNRLTEFELGVVVGSESQFMAKLVHVDVSFNAIARFLTSHVHFLASALHINAGSNCINAIPADIIYLYRLETLLLDNNDLTELPRRIDDLVNLKTLHLQENLITALPDGITKLPKLTDLNVSSNKIFIWPKKWGAFRLKLLAINQDDQRSQKRQPRQPPPTLPDLPKTADGSTKAGGRRARRKKAVTRRKASPLRGAQRAKQTT